LITGLGYRNTGDNIDTSSISFRFLPHKRNDNLFSGFIQDEFKFFNERLKIFFGSKFERNDYTGYEIQPNARFLWKINENSSFWGAVSRAVKTPSRADHTMNLAAFTRDVNDPLNVINSPLIAFLKGNEQFVSEDLLAWELGYKSEINKNLYIDTTLFLKRYTNLQSLQDFDLQFFDIPETSDPSDSYVHSFLPFLNSAGGTSYGFEVTSTYSFSNSLKWKNNYSYFHLNIHDPSTVFQISKVNETFYPTHMLQSILSFNPSPNLETDYILYYNDNLLGFGDDVIQPNLRFDSRIGYRLSKNSEISLVCQNIFNSSQNESFNAFSYLQPGRNERSYYARLTHKF
jgi:iron complex outermembrane recepter protein